MRNLRKKERIGRNDPCPCKSGKKFKRCCLGISQKEESWSVHKLEDIRSRLPIEIKRAEAFEKQRIALQGHGRPIVSSDNGESKVVIVGDEAHILDSECTTFHQFLLTYIERVFGEEWFTTELNKTANPHPLIEFYRKVLTFTQNMAYKGGQGISQEIMTGAVSAYLGLAYNLYILQHNVEITQRLVHRLKDPNDFYGALYETYVDAFFIKAGFDIELENESGRLGIPTCEFVATHKETKRKFSVEAKVRGPNKDNNDVGTQLYKALKKTASYERIVFIELNTDDNRNGEIAKRKLEEARTSLRTREPHLTISQKPAPEAYIFITNHPFYYHLDSADNFFTIMPEGFKIPDFKTDYKYKNGQEYLAVQEKHSELIKLSNAFEHYFLEVPATFDGELPEFAFNIDNPRLLIGNKYIVQNKQGKPVEAVLETATVLEQDGRSSAYGVYFTEFEERLIAVSPLSEIELQAYHKYPETFFGVNLKQTRKVDSPVEIFEVMHEIYKHTPKEKLLEWMKDSKDIDRLKEMNSKDLAIIYCEGIATSINKKTTK